MTVLRGGRELRHGIGEREGEERRCELREGDERCGLREGDERRCWLREGDERRCGLREGDERRCGLRGDKREGKLRWSFLHNR